MASVKAFASAGTWNFTGDIRSYLLCCFSNPSSSKSEAKKQQQLGQSDTDAELARHLTDVETIGLTAADTATELPDTGQADDGNNRSRSGAKSSDDDDSKTDQRKSFDQAASTLCPAAAAAAVCDIQPLKASFDAGHSASPSCALAVTSAEVHCDAGFPSEDDAERRPSGDAADPTATAEDLSGGCDQRPALLRVLTTDAVDSTTDETTTTTTKASSSVEDPSNNCADNNNPDSDDRLFDVSDLQDVSRCGRLHVTFDYSVKSQRLTVTVHEATEIPNQERGGSTDTQVRLTLLPTKNTRHRTKVIRSNENPKYDETFQIKLPKDELNRCGLRLRLYGCQRMARERMIGECVVRFVTLSLDRPTSQWLTLEPRSSLADTDRGSLERRSRSSSAASGSSQSMDLEGTSELLLSLSYNAITGRLTVEVLQATNLKCLATNRAPDTYVRVTLMSSSGKELMRSSTSVRKMSPNPVYREKFMFQVVEAQLAEVSLMVSVYGKRSLKREELVGWFILGYSNSGEDETLHWNDMRLSSGSPVERWHVLAEP